MPRLITLDALDDVWWPKARLLYHEAFQHGRKPDAIIALMFKRRFAFLHLLVDGEELLGMAITGITGPKNDILLIDYLAVRKEIQGQGIGKRMLQEIALWAESHRNLTGIIVEVEAEDTEENLARIHFWERCGYTITAYIHSYIWVPEPYRAMYKILEPTNQSFPTDGQTLFRHITSLHEKSFRKEKN